MGHDDTGERTTHQVVLIAVDSEGDLARATARLPWRDTMLQGVGRARLKSDDETAIGLRDELAVARALSNVANQLFAASVSAIETVTEQRPRLTSVPGGRR
jgi:Domain of unknown function (DUF1876)